MEKTKHLTEELKRIICVGQEGKKNPKVKWCVEGFESMVTMSIVMARQLKLKVGGVIHVFDAETKQWLGQMVKVDEVRIEKFKADEELYFNDFYQEAR